MSILGDTGNDYFAEQSQQHWSEWVQEVSADWRGLTANNLRPLFTPLASLHLREESKQNRYKLSYYVPLPTNLLALQQ